MVDAGYYEELLRPLFSGRKIVLISEVLAGAPVLQSLRRLGADRCLVIAYGLGTGPLPSPDDADWIVSDYPASDVVTALRTIGAYMADPSPEVLSALDAYEPGNRNAGEWKKPDRRFFECVAEQMALPAEELMYVGDRLDNDVRPAEAAGMEAVWIRRGPWAKGLGALSDPSVAYAVIDWLDEVPPLVAGGPPSEGARTLPNSKKNDKPPSR